MDEWETWLLEGLQEQRVLEQYILCGRQDGKTTDLAGMDIVNNKKGGKVAPQKDVNKTNTEES